MTTDSAPPARLPAVPVCAIAAAVAIGVALDRAATYGPNTVAGTLAFGGAGMAVALVPRRCRDRAAWTGRALGVVAALLTLALFMRAGAVAPLGLLAAAAAIALAVVAHRGGSVFDATTPRLVARALTAAYDAIRLPGPIASWLGSARDHAVTSPDGRRRLSSYTRGLVLAFGVMLLVVPLLAAGDAVFASLVSVDVDLGPLPAHLVVVAIGAAGAGALLYAASRSEPVVDLPAGPTLGSVECRIVLATLGAVHTAFVGGRVVAVLGGAEHVLETAGLTYAEYARSGFFQLLAAVAVTLIALLGIRGMRRLDAVVDGWVTALSIAVALLTLVCVVTAVQRLLLYEDAFGLTVLRLLALAIAGWLGLLLLLVIASLAGVGTGSEWLPGAIAVSLLAIVLALTVANPDSIVVRRNIDRAAAGGTFDAAYVAGLSADAVPTLIERLGRLSTMQRDSTVRLLCEQHEASDPGAGLSWNLARARAERALDAVC